MAVELSEPKTQTAEPVAKDTGQITPDITGTSAAPSSESILVGKLQEQLGNTIIDAALSGTLDAFGTAVMNSIVDGMDNPGPTHSGFSTNSAMNHRLKGQTARNEPANSLSTPGPPCSVGRDSSTGNLCFESASVALRPRKPQSVPSANRAALDHAAWSLGADMFYVMAPGGLT
jgi:hypothetical protein